MNNKNEITTSNKRYHNFYYHNVRKKKIKKNKEKINNIRVIFDRINTTIEI
jgi:hypothetical protein